MSKKKNAALYVAILIGLLVWNFNSLLTQGISDGFNYAGEATGIEWLMNFYVQTVVTLAILAFVLLIVLDISWKRISGALG